MMLSPRPRKKLYSHRRGQSKVLRLTYDFFGVELRRLALTKYQLKQEETSIVKDIINENKRILEAEKNIKTDKKRQYLNVERDMIQWKEDTRLLEEELEASRRESVMPIASTGINKLKSMWKLFNEECIKEENVHPETM